MPFTKGIDKLASEGRGELLPIEAELRHYELLTSSHLESFGNWVKNGLHSITLDSNYDPCTELLLSHHPTNLLGKTDWEKLRGLRSLQITFMEAEDLPFFATLPPPHPVFDIPTFSGPPLNLQQFRIKIDPGSYFEHLDECHDGTGTINLEAMSSIANALLSIGGPTCEYSVSTTEHLAASCVTILRDEIERLQNAQPKGWVWTRKTPIATFTEDSVGEDSVCDDGGECWQ